LSQSATNPTAGSGSKSLASSASATSGISGDAAKDDASSRFPYTKSLEQLQEQSVAPATHFVYALTW
jgi:hypothetical protein